MLLDPLDRQLIALLRRDARLPIATLAKQLGVSRGTVQNRMQRLEREGVVAGYTLRLAEHEDKAGVQAITLIEVHGAATDQVIAALRRLPEAAQVHHQIPAADLNAFDRVLRELRSIAGVANSESHLLLAVHR